MKRHVFWVLSIVLLGGVAGCPGGDDDDQGGQGFIQSCQNMVTATIPSCVEHYADPSVAAAVAPSYMAICKVQGGMVSKARCPTGNLVGICTITGGAGAAYGIQEKLFIYGPEARPGTARASCMAQHGTFEMAADAGAANAGGGA